MEWLKELKIGDEVIVEERRKSNLNYRLLKIKSITRTGKIRLENDSLYTNGYYTDRRECRHYSTWKNCCLIPATKENIEKLVERPEVIKYLNNFNFGNIEDTKMLTFLKNMIKLEEEKQCCQ